MDIGLREWLIIGGVLIVILILVDGWRRVSANRTRLRLEIDRTLSELAEEDQPYNPELPNGGARVRAGERQGRVEPGFADDPPAAVAPGADSELDPLFDEIPAAATPVRRQPATARPPESEPAAARGEPEPAAPEQAPLDLEQPIPVLFDALDADGNSRRLPEDTLAAYRESVDQAREPATPPDDSPADESPAPVMENAAAAEPTADPESPRGAAAPSAAPASRGLKRLPDPEHVLIITVVGRNGQYLPGPALHKIVTACGMEWGDMSIYHRAEDDSPESPIQFSMANAVAPGTFDPDHLDALETPAVTFFMSMDEPGDPMTAYECMLATAETVAKHLDGDLLDEDRSVMRPQTKEHYRERIRDFEMHRRQRRAN